MLALTVLLHAAALALAPLPSVATYGSGGHHAAPARTKYVIAHRGASGKFPEETREAYKQAIKDGADFIECDVVLSKDRHDIYLSETTNANEVFPDKNATYSYDDVTKTGVFAPDLTYAQVQKLRMVQPNKLRDPQYNGEFKLVTLEEYIKVALAADRPVGIYPETKFPEYHDALLSGTTISHIVLGVLTKYGYEGPMGSHAWKKQPVFIQSFEVNNLKYLKHKTKIPLIQLLRTRPDELIFDVNITVAEATSDKGLAAIAEYAAGIGPGMDAIRIATEQGYAGEVTALVSRAHKAGLDVHPYTFRAEYVDLKWNYAVDLYKEFFAFFETIGVDGVFTDQPHQGGAFLDRVKLGCTRRHYGGQHPGNQRRGLLTTGRRRRSGGAATSKLPKGVVGTTSGKCQGGISRAALAGKKPFLIAHRGSSGLLPEETAEAYSLAVEQGADFIECDVVLTKDRVPICRHEPLLSNTTNADDVFADRVTNYTIDGAEYSGVFSVDLTLAEVTTLDEYITIALTAGKRSVGIYPETKHPTWHDSLPFMKDTSISEILLRALEKRGYGGDIYSKAWAAQPVFIQSFEAGNLKQLSKKTDIPLIQLTDDFTTAVPGSKDGTTYADLLTKEGIADIATYATGMGPWKNTLIPVDPGTNLLGKPTGVADMIHAAGLAMHPYTLRNESPTYLAYDFVADPRAEYDVLFKELGFDGAFTDFAGTLHDYFLRNEKEGYTWDKLVLYKAKLG